MRKWTRWILPFLVATTMARLSAQVPFDCTGQFYISFTTDVTSSLVEAVIDPVTDQVTFVSISNNLGTFINGAGYRSTDNFIYAVEPILHYLYQIDATGTARNLGQLDLNPNHAYLAADISPDGKYLVLIGTLGNFGSSNQNRDAQIAKVDLSSGNYEVDFVDLSGPGVNMLDIAFDPTDGKLFGVDAWGNRLVRINYVSGEVSTPFPQTPLMDDAGSLFFDSFGDMYAYGGPPGNNGKQTTLYKVDKLTGEFRILTTGTVAIATDGCSCPHTIELRKVVEPRTMVPCGEVEYVFTIANSSTEAQMGIDLVDTLPDEFTILEIEYNPYGGVIESSIGTNVLSIRDLTLLPGIDSIILRVEVGDVRDGIYKNQAVLTDLPQALGSFALSDDPETIIKHDSTALRVVHYDNAVEKSIAICAGDITVLNAAEFGTVFLWDDGSTESQRVVSKEGLYSVIAATSCDSLFILFDVQATDISVSFDPIEYELRLGDSVLLTPIVINEGQQTMYRWLVPEGGFMKCSDCPKNLVAPYFDTEYTVVVENEAGCKASASVLVRVDRTQKWFAPNIFSPNGDQINDQFYFVFRGVAEIRRFTIFDRWGDIIQTGSTPMMRDPQVQWSGLSRSNAYLPGVYVWVAEVGFIDGTREFYSRDITLIR